MDPSTGGLATARWRQQAGHSIRQGSSEPLGTQTAPGAPRRRHHFSATVAVHHSTRLGGGQQDQIQVFGQTKIIADQRSNSLLVFATQADMDRIKAVIDKLDVLLSQVLIESVIMEVSLGKQWNLGRFGRPKSECNQHAKL